MTKKIHFHSDNTFFAGSENMLIHFFHDEDLNKAYDLSFSFNNYPLYRQGLLQRLKRALTTYPMRFYDFHNRSLLPDWLPSRLKSAILRPARLLFNGLLFCWDIIVLFRLFKKVQPDVLHLNNGAYPGAMSVRAAAVAGRLAGVRRIIMVVNNMTIPYSDYMRWKQYFTDQWVKHCVDTFVTGSLRASCSLQEVLNLPKDKIQSIYNGIPAISPEVVQAAAPRASIPLTFAIVAIFAERKGHLVLFDAVEAVLRRRPDFRGSFRLLIIGDGPRAPLLKATVQEKQLDDHIQFIGEQRNYQDFLQPVDVLVLPSLAYEDFPFAVIEAMSMARPVIGTDVAGMPEQIDHGETGLLCTPGEPEEIAAAMLYFLENPARVQEMGRKGLEKFNRSFRLEIALQAYRHLYL